jgi:LDH2 family malate/lactate/ureidoglycolate dehydrogenase
MRDFAEILHGSPAAEEGKPVIVPGEIELRRMREQRAVGIDIKADVLALLRRRAGATA